MSGLSDWVISNCHCSLQYVRINSAMQRLDQLTINLMLGADYKSQTRWYDSAAASRYSRKLEAKVVREVAEIVVAPQNRMMKAFRIEDFKNRLMMPEDVAASSEEHEPCSACLSTVPQACKLQWLCVQ